MDQFTYYPNNLPETQAFLHELVARPINTEKFISNLKLFFDNLSYDQIKEFLTSDEETAPHDYKLRLYKYTDLGDRLVLPKYLLGYRHDIQLLDQELKLSRGMKMGLKSGQIVSVRLPKISKSLGIRYLMIDAFENIDSCDDELGLFLQRYLDELDEDNFSRYYYAINKSKPDIVESHKKWQEAGVTRIPISRTSFGKEFINKIFKSKSEPKIRQLVDSFLKENPEVKIKVEGTKFFRIDLKALYKVTITNHKYKGLDKYIHLLEKYI